MATHAIGPSLRVALAGGFIAFVAAGCLQIDTGTGDPPGSSGGSSPSGSGTPATLTGEDGGAAGTSCGSDPTTGTTLCLGVTSCPSLTIDPNAWPSCGFRPTGGSTLDLECLCGDSLCPIGVATSCETATSLLSMQTQLMVCEQVSEQRCVAVTPATGASGGEDAGTPSTCNQTCLVGCGTADDCRQLCGC
jgi:hypothetical protein